MYVFRIIYQYFEENYFSSSLNSQYDNLPFTKTATTLLMLVGGLCLGILIASFIIVFEKRVVGKFIRGLLTGGACDKDHAMSLEDLGLSQNGFIKRELSRASVSRKLVSVVGADGEVTSYEDALAAAFPEFAQAIREKSEQKETEEAEAVTIEEPLPEEEAAKEAAAGEAGTEASSVEARGGLFKRAKNKTKDFLFEKKFKPSPLDFATVRFFIPESLVYRAELRFREKGSSPWLLVLAVFLVLALFLLGLRFIPVFVEMLDSTIGNLRGL